MKRVAIAAVLLCLAGCCGGSSPGARRECDGSSREVLDANAVQLASLSAESFIGGADFPSPPLPGWLVKYLRHLASASDDPLSLVTFRDPRDLHSGTVQVWGSRVDDARFEFRYLPYEPGKGDGAISTRIAVWPDGKLGWTPLRGAFSSFADPAGEPPAGAGAREPGAPVDADGG